MAVSRRLPERYSVLINVEQHLSNPCSVLGLLQDADVVRKLKKCSLFIENINSLFYDGHLDTFDMAVSNTGAIRQLHDPTTQEKI